MNASFFHFFNDFAGRSLVGDAVIVFFAKYFIYFLIAIMVVFVWRDFKRSPRRRFNIDFISLFLTLIAVSAVTKILHTVYDHARPLVTFDIFSLITETSNSFPSGHTIFIFGMATAAYFYSKKLFYFLAVSGIAVGLARITAGVHYPLDIVGGAILGILVGLAIEYVCRRLYPEKQATNP